MRWMWLHERVEVSIVTAITNSLFSQREGKAMEGAWWENRNHIKNEMMCQRVKLNWRRRCKQSCNRASLNPTFVTFLIYIINSCQWFSTQFPSQALALGNETVSGQYTDSNAQLRRIWERHEGQAFQVAGRVDARWGGTALEKVPNCSCNSQAWTIGKVRARGSGELDCLWVFYLICLFLLSAERWMGIKHEAHRKEIYFPCKTRQVLKHPVL